MRWQDHITSDPAVLAGKPIISGTRISVEFLLTLMASGWPQEKILAEYPQLSAQAIEAALVFAAEAVEHELVYPVRRPGAA
ncbi:MAG: DUF433 domain-containing protein [Gemmatimonadaceae bacterium]